MSRNTLIGVEWGRKSLAYERLWDLAEALDTSVEDLVANFKSCHPDHGTKGR